MPDHRAQVCRPQTSLVCVYTSSRAAARAWHAKHTRAPGAEQPPLPGPAAPWTGAASRAEQRQCEHRMWVDGPGAGHTWDHLSRETNCEI